MKLVEEKKELGENKKVRNAKIVVTDGITFRSDLEAKCYKKLRDAGFEPMYEAEKFTLLDGFKIENNIQLWLPEYKSKKIIGFGRNTSKIQAITYKPDFMFEHNGYMIVIEVKGHPNDAYPIKRKMFFRILQETIEDNQNIVFFEPHNVGQIDKTIEIIKGLGND